MEADKPELSASILLFLHARPRELERFLGSTGTQPDQLRALMGNAAFADGLLDYLVSNEPLLLAYCEETGDRPARLGALAARAGGWM